MAELEVTRLRRENERLENEVAAIKDIHQRILSWKPQDVHAAKATLLQLAASRARQGYSGERYVEAVDTLMRFVSQTRADEDALRSLLRRAAGVIRDRVALIPSERDAALLTEIEAQLGPGRTNDA